jgi:hypothetical protein
MKRVFSILFALALVLGLSLVVTTPVAAGTTYYVDDSGNDGNGGTGWGDAWRHIQYAINNVASGDTIMVGAGTYDETVNVVGFAGLTISGIDKTQVTIRSSTTLDWNVGGYGSSRKVVFRIVNSTDVVLENMTVDFNLVKGNLIHGILYWDSTGTVDNNMLKNMSVSDAGGGYYEITSYFRADSYSPGSRADITISNNTFIDAGRLGACLHTYVDATITGNTFYKTTDDFGYAIELGSEATGTISDNTMYGYDTAALSDGSNSAGIYIENSFTGSHVTPLTKTVSVIGNEVYDSQWGLYVGNEFDGYTGDVDIVLDVSNNNFHDNTDGGVVITDEDKEYGSSVSVSGGGNSLVDNTDYGYYIYTQGDGDITVDLTGETITNHDIGVYVQDTAGGSSTSSYSVSIQSSGITGSTTFGMDNTVNTFVLDARYDWWGADDGPSGAGPGSGDAVSSYVDYSSWAGHTSTSTGSGTATFTPDAGTLTGLSAVAEGSLPAQAQATKPISFPDGLFSFDITGLTPGATVTVTITLPPGAAPTQYWKYHASEGGWIQIPMTIVGPPNVIKITLVDGGLGDDDGAANGVIVDQGGPGGGAVGWETYPVSKARVLLPWLALLAVVAGGASLLVLRRRRTQT